MPTFDPPILDLIRTIASVVTSCVALIALGTAITQIVINRRTQIDVRVKNLYAKYVEKSVDWAPISSPPAHEFDWENKKLYKSDDKFSKYIWYLSYMLDTCEEIFLLTKQKSWRETIKYQICLHKNALNSDYITRKKVIGLYTEDFSKFVSDTLASGKEPGCA